MAGSKGFTKQGLFKWSADNQRRGRIERGPECWIWRGPVGRSGYGNVAYRGIVGAHRIMWVFRHGRLPEGVLRNTCGNRLCVRPEHWVEEVPVRSRLHMRREMMRDLHGQGLGIGEIAERVGCSRVTVWRFVRGLPLPEIGVDE